MQQWINASELSSYGQVPPGLSSPSFSNAPVAIAQRPVNAPASPLRNPPASPSSSGARQVLVGSEVKGTLETPIAWSSNPPANRRFIVKITESLKASDGSVILPDNSYVVVQVARADQNGLLELSANSVLMVQGDRQVEKPLPNGAIMIVDRRGRPLIANSHHRSTFWSRVGTAALAGVESAAELYNRPTSQSVTSSLGGYSSTTQSNDPDYGAAFVQGGTESLVTALQNQQERTQQEAQQSPPMFVIDQGTKLRLYVNNSFSF
jgi:Bacterial conjugation TrbI-like protein